MKKIFAIMLLFILTSNVSFACEACERAKMNLANSKCEHTCECLNENGKCTCRTTGCKCGKIKKSKCTCRTKDRKRAGELFF